MQRTFFKSTNNAKIFVRNLLPNKIPEATKVLYNPFPRFIQESLAIIP